MDEFFVTSVGSGGTATTSKHFTLDDGQKALEDEKSRILRGEIIGAALDQQTSSGVVHPVRSLLSHTDPNVDVFLNTIKDLRRQGYKTLQGS